MHNNKKMTRRRFVSASVNLLLSTTNVSLFGALLVDYSDVIPKCPEDDSESETAVSLADIPKPE